MSVILRLAAAALALVVGPGAAAAQGFGPSRPALWTGFYVGASIGGGSADADASFNGQTVSGSDSGLAVGLNLGYNYQLGDFVLGVEGDYTWLTGDGDSDLPSVRARLGWASGPLLFYATAGVAWTQSSVAFTNGITSTNVETTHTGYAIGGGIEWQFTRNVSVRGEVISYMFDDEKVSAPGGGTASVDIDAIVYRLGVTYRF